MWHNGSGRSESEISRSEFVPLVFWHLNISADGGREKAGCGRGGRDGRRTKEERGEEPTGSDQILRGELPP